MKHKYDIPIWIPTSIFDGTETYEEYIERNADELYEDYVVDRRFSPEDVIKLLRIGQQRKMEISSKL